jgi:cytoskeletal protein CcmA (bactofilin family)
MTDQFVKAGSTVKLGRVEGDLSVGRRATIKPESGGRVFVTGTARFEGEVTIDSDFVCQSMRVEGKGFGPGGDVRINGSLQVEGRADIDASARVSGPVRAGDLDVGGHFRSLQLSTNRLRIGGHLEARGALEAKEVDVGGHMTVVGEVKIDNLRVGGHAKIGGGSISGDVRIRGHFDTSKKLAFGRMETYGNTVLPPGSSGERLAILGRVEFDGDSFCRELEVTGTAKSRGKLSAENFSLKGNLIASGGVQVSKRFQVWGTADVGGTLACGTLAVGGKLVADEASAAERIDVVGEAGTNRGLKSATVVVGKGSKVAGPIYAENADVGSDADLGSIWGLPWWRGMLGRLTTVEDVHGGTIRIRSQSRAGRIFGKIVEMEEGAMAEEVVYTDQIKLPRRYFLTKPPRKVEELPDHPI